ncbi:hypothetical protein P9112_008665 [Eukaryota sp. TZLM1-RC]
MSPISPKRTVFAVVVLSSLVLSFFFASPFITLFSTDSPSQNPLGDDYGYSGTINDIRKRQFPQLSDNVYLDYAGAGIPAKTQAQQLYDLLTTSSLGNPHTRSPSSQRSTKGVNDARKAVMKHFNLSPDQYSVIFTSGTTAGLRMISEGLSFTSDSNFVYTIDNHVSVLGMRKSVLSAGGHFKALHFNEVFEYVSSINSELQQLNKTNAINIFAFPAQSNFAGNRYPLDIINKIYQDCDEKGVRRWLITLDAASMVSCCCFNMSNIESSPDFLPISFYKMFGYPTGLGALIAKNSALDLVNPSYFGGGTVTAVLPDRDWEVKRKSHAARLEFGTISFTDISSLTFGLDFMEQLGMENIAKHTMSLTYHLAENLANLTHSNGQPLVCLYGNFPNSTKSMPGSVGQGPIVAFTLKKSNGETIPHSAVLKHCTNNNISIRAGCVCNHGSCFYMAGVADEEVYARFKAGCECDGGCCASVGELPGQVNQNLIDKSFVSLRSQNHCWEDFYPRGQFAGILRASIGAPTTLEDVNALVEALKYFIDS